ncbi:MAG: flagellar motor protein MotA [Gammaproteobacteria bacterium]|nr:MAG: flagellar motor protein MotA [Gammaproteobacteria bacterium]
MTQDLLARLPDSLQYLVSSGGVVVAILLVMAVLLTTVFLVKIWQLWHAGVLFSVATKRVHKAIDAHIDGAGSAPPHQTARQLPAEQMAADIVTLAYSHRLRGAPLVAEARRQLEHYQRRLRSHLPLMELIATLSPSLGLLGTVLGMIQAFRAMELAGRDVDPAVLSGGIWQALLTTAVGLAVAIPAIILLNWLSRRIDTHLGNIDDQISRVLNFAPADADTAATGALPVNEQLSASVRNQRHAAN